MNLQYESRVNHATCNKQEIAKDKQVNLVNTHVTERLVYSDTYSYMLNMCIHIW